MNNGIINIGECKKKYDGVFAFDNNHPFLDVINNILLNHNICYCCKNNDIDKKELCSGCIIYLCERCGIIQNKPVKYAGNEQIYLCQNCHNTTNE